MASFPRHMALSGGECTNCEIEVFTPRLTCWQDYKEISMRLKEIPRGEERSAEQLIEHYELEKELACKLKNSTREERKKLYTILYDELFQKIPHHPQLLKKSANTNTA
jgi:hypothetical protein